MPLRIVFVVALTAAACTSLVAPSSAHAMSSSSDDADLGSSDTVPIAGPTSAAVTRDGTVGLKTSTSEAHPGISGAREHLPSLSGVGLAAAIVAGFLPAIIMMVRSHRRRRAGGSSGSSAAGPLHAGDSATFGAA
jgi:hypothetical protein